MPSDALGVGHRLAADPSQLLAATAFDHELQAAPALWEPMGDADLAHAIALDDAGLLPPDVRDVLLRALIEAAAVPLDAVELDPAVGDVYNNRDRMLRRMAGPVAGHLHAGRARREASTIAWQLTCRSRVLELGLATAGLLEQLATTASAHVDTVMPDFTYLHRAQPTTLGHYLLGHAGPVARHLERVDRAVTSVDASPAGSGSTNGSRLPIRRELLAELLGFATSVRHTRDAMWAPDMALDLLHVCVQVMSSVDRLAEELQLWTTEAFDFAELGDASSRTSVVMPHKKNPYALTYLRGASRQTLGTATGVAATMLTASGQPDNRTFAYLHVPLLLTDTARAVALLSEVVATTRFNTAAMHAAASAGFVTSTEICDALVLAGRLDNRRAHDVVGRAVRIAVDDGRDQLTFDDLSTSAADEGIADLGIAAARLAELLDPRETIASRVTPGGASATEVTAMCTEFGDAAARWRAAFGQHPSHGYRLRLLARAEALVGGSDGAGATP